MPYPSHRMLDEIETTLDKCIHYHELIELLDEQLAACTDPDKLKEIQDAIKAHTTSNEAMLQAMVHKLRNHKQ